MNNNFLHIHHNSNNSKKRYFFALIILLLLFQTTFAEGQERFRRHFIIAYDVSTPFIIAEKTSKNYEKTLIDLFDNKNLSYFNQATLTNLLNEKKNGLTFFDPQKDEISFFHFNIAKSEFDDLKFSKGKAIVDDFCKTFIKNKQLYWSDYKGHISNSISDYLKYTFDIKTTPRDFGDGVSISNFVYPLILNRIDTTKYAEEYVLVILSDFLTGSMQGNKMDFDRIKDVYGSGNIAPNLIKVFSDELSSSYYKIDYFEFPFVQTTNGKPISIIGYKIKPKAGNYNPEDVAVFIDSDIKLIQRGYKSEKFKVPENYIRFTHNVNLKPVEVSLEINASVDNRSAVLFSGIIAKLNSQGIWISDYTSNLNLMKYDKSKNLYYIPTLKIRLDSIINKGNYDFVNFDYKINTTYKINNANPLNYVYTAERLINKKSIIFTPKLTVFIMYYVIPIFILLLIVLYLVYIGKPKAIKSEIYEYLDSYQSINYKKHGKLVTPYKFWHEKSDNLLIEGKLLYKYNNYIFNWKPEIYLSIQEEDIPQGFDLFLKPNNKIVKEFSKGNIMSLNIDNENDFKFTVNLRQNDINIKITEPLLISFKINALIRETKFFFITSTVRDTIEYKFHIGNDLGDLWVAFDPGTTGSCVAIGNEAENITIADVSKSVVTGSKIMPSVLIFDHSYSFDRENTNSIQNAYKYGTAALGNWETAKYRFQSIKKLLGYVDKKNIKFDNNTQVELSGKELSSFLVKGLYNELSKFVHSTNNQEFLVDSKNKLFNPQRAVVAIPNNFTISKIQDMVDCVDYLKQFKEVRYVYEAEAILFYYISKYSRFNNGDNNIKDESILVFDMGGATINATIVNVSKYEIKKKTIYDINLLGKIGYGIGGDTIDYCLIKFLLSFSGEYGILKSIKIDIDRDKLSKLAQDIKKEMVKNYQKNFDFLITARDLEKFLQDRLEIDIKIDEESKIYQYFKKDTNGKFKLLTHPIFVNTIFENIKDAVNEVLNLSNNCTLDKVIFSGRSTFFPYIQDTVEKQLKLKNSTPTKITFGVEESKTAVAYGACWYGINKNAIRLNNLKTNASFGIKQTKSPETTDVEFIELVEMGLPFDQNNSGIEIITGTKNIASDFSFDGAKVNFFQVMGKDANLILSRNQKHKFSKVASIRIPQPTDAIQMVIKEDDGIACKVKLITDRVLETEGVVSDQEITDANEEHYTWIIN